jgi:hypothetical protein
MTISSFISNSCVLATVPREGLARSPAAADGRIRAGQGFAPRVRFLDSTAFRRRKSAGPGYLALHKIVAQGLETA